VIHALVTTLLIAVFTVEYLIRSRGLLHPYMILVPELLSAIAMVIVLARIVAGVRIALDVRYVLFFVVLIVTLICGFVLQDVPIGAVVAGIRAHLKFIPFFLLAAVYRFTPEQLTAQMKVLLVILVLETPLAVYQRFIEFAGHMETGDYIKGTASTSSALSLVLLFGIATVVSLYLRKKIALPKTLALIGVLFLPTTINETKATLLLLPVVLIAPAMYMAKGSRAFRRLLPIVAAGTLAGIVFIGVYDTLIQNRPNGQTIGAFIGDGRFEKYLYRGGEDGPEHIGRFDSVEIAIERISRDPLTLAIGMGAGNVSTSFLSAFDGKYAFYQVRYGIGMTQVTTFLWEIGLVGLASYLFLYWCVYRDSRMLARGSGAPAIVGQIWVTVTLLMTFGLIYKSVFAFNEIGYLFWYFSGIAASEAVLQRRERRARLARAPALFDHREDVQSAGVFRPPAGGDGPRPVGPLASARTMS
jgi:hypothetical protein